MKTSHLYCPGPCCKTGLGCSRPVKTICTDRGRGLRAHFALNLPRKDLRILVGILAGHADLNRHLHIMGLCQDSVYPLRQEERDTTAHFIADCSALMLLRKNILGEYILSFDTLCSIYWFLS